MSTLVLTEGPNWSLNVLSKSGLGTTGVASSPGSAEASREGAELTLDDVAPEPCFLRFRAAGTKAVLSFLKSRSWGSADTVAALETDALLGIEGAWLALGLAGKDGWGGGRVRAARCA